MVRKKFSFKKLLIALILLCVFICALLVGTYFYLINTHGNSDEDVIITVNEGETYSSIVDELKEKELINSKIVYKIYLKLNNPGDLEYGSYNLNKSYSLKETIDIMKKGSVSSGVIKSITFVEGKNMRYYIDTITREFSITEKEILNTLSDETYLDELISTYWFLDSEIKDKNIYYSLEGYLYPDTYEFYETASIKDIFKKLLDNMETKLNKYKSEIKSSKYTMHEMITLASIIELEAGSSNDRKGVAGVFYNRIADGWSLGSDVTTYYAEKMDDWLTDLTQKQLNSCNSYNTRSSCMAGKLPVGPICNPGIESIEATIEPTNHSYYYFTADKNGKTYFNKTYSAHEATVDKIKSEGLWIDYEN